MAAAMNAARLLARSLLPSNTASVQSSAAACRAGTSCSSAVARCSCSDCSSRGFHTSVSCAHGDAAPQTTGETVTVTFVDKDGAEQTVAGAVGKSVLEVAHANDVELEGACEGSLACSTCHVIVEDENMFKQLGEPCEDELDMLDLAFGLQPTSRLGCQIVLSKEMEGLRVRLPSATRNMYVDGHKPKPH